MDKFNKEQLADKVMKRPSLVYRLSSNMLDDIKYMKKTLK